MFDISRKSPFLQKFQFLKTYNQKYVNLKFEF